MLLKKRWWRPARLTKDLNDGKQPQKNLFKIRRNHHDQSGN